MMKRFSNFNGVRIVRRKFCTQMQSQAPTVLTPVQRQAHIGLLKDWNTHSERDAIWRSFRFKKEEESGMFIQYLNMKKKRDDQLHLKVEGPEVYVELFTEEVKGLTLWDIQMLKEINDILGIYYQHFSNTTLSERQERTEDRDKRKSNFDDDNAPTRKSLEQMLEESKKK